MYYMELFLNEKNAFFQCNSYGKKYIVYFINHKQSHTKNIFILDVFIMIFYFRVVIILNIHFNFIMIWIQSDKVIKV